MITRIERTALHEAGHAVVVCLSPLLPPLRAVFLNFSPGGGGRNVLEVLDSAALEGSDLGEYHELIGQAIRALCAGPLAEALAFPDFQLDRREGTDFAKIVRLMEMLYRHEILACLWTLTRLDAARELEIERRVRARVEGAFAGAEVLLRSSWGAVERVAAKLIECGGSLPRELVELLIDQAPKTTKPCATIEQDIALTGKAAAGDRMLRAAALEALKAVEREVADSEVGRRTGLGRDEMRRTKRHVSPGETHSARRPAA